MNHVVPLLLAALCPAGVDFETNDPRPNVLFILSDDQRADTFGALGHPDVRTPALDRLLEEGTFFERAYCQGSKQGAVCAPSRAMIFTGRGLFQLPPNPFDLPDDVELLPELLARAGYETFASGKWHNGKSAFARGFSAGDEIFFGGMGSHTELAVHDFDPNGVYPDEARHTLESFSSTSFVDATIEFLETRDRERPFFAHVSFTAPHDPRTPPEAFRSLYDPGQLTVPANFLPEHPFDNGELSVRDEKLAPWPRTPEVLRQHLADYYGMISQMDAEVGRLLDALSEQGLRENTFIVFASDHGLAIGSHGLLGKQNLYEHSMRTPLVLAGPGVPAGARNESFVYLFDLFPTVCEIAGIEPGESPEGNQARSLWDTLGGTPADWREGVFTAYGSVQRAYRDGRWKLITYPRLDRQQLFDLENDPHEVRDLMQQSDDAVRNQAQAMAERLADLARANDDPLRESEVDSK